MSILSKEKQTGMTAGEYVLSQNAGYQEQLKQELVQKAEISELLSRGADPISLAGKYNGQMISDVMKQQEADYFKKLDSLPGGFQDPMPVYSNGLAQPARR